MRPSEKAWITLGVGVLGYDLLCPPGEMLSQRCAQYMAAQPLLTGAVITYVALHLMDRLPKRIDLLNRLAVWAGRI